MNKPQPDDTFSKALRAELVSRAQKAVPSRTRGRTRLWLGACALAGAGLLGGTTVLVTASAPTPPDRFLDATRIIPSLSEPQKDTDKLSAAVMDIYGHVEAQTPGQDAIVRRDIDPSKTRRVGQSDTFTYYAAPAGDDLICMIPVDAKGEAHGKGCAMLNNFDGSGMKLVFLDGKEAGWLMVPAAVEKNLESVEDEPGWTQQAPNFLVRNNH